MPTIASIRANGQKVCSDVTIPKPVRVRVAEFGDLVVGSSSNRRDPLVLQLSDVEAGCKLQVLNKSVAPNAQWDKAAQDLPGSTLKHLPNGQYNLVLTNELTEKLNIKPGDVFELRQVDASGNASAPTVVALKQVNGRRVNVGFDGVTDTFDGSKPVGPHTVVEYADGRPAGAAPEAMRFIPTANGDGFVFSGQNAAEPFSKIYVNELVNGNYTGKSYEVPVGNDGSFQKTLPLLDGQQVNVTIYDHNVNGSELGRLTVTSDYDSTPVKGEPTGARMPPTVDESRLTLSPHPEPGKAIFAGECAVKGGKRVIVENERTREAVSADIDRNGSFRLELKGEQGDPLHIQFVATFDEVRAHDKIADLGILPLDLGCNDKPTGQTKQVPTQIG